MVAGSAYHSTHYFGPAGYIGWNFGYCTFYLHVILMNKPQRQKELETILVLVIALAIFYWVYKKPLLLLVLVLTGMTGLFIPAAAKAIHWLWMKLAAGMGFLMSKVILTIIFIVVVIPLGWISGKAGKSSVNLKPGGSTYFKDREHIFTKADMENPW